MCSIPERSTRANPTVAIPLPYEPLHPQQMDTTPDSAAMQIVNKRLKLTADTWHRKVKLNKAVEKRSS